MGCAGSTQSQADGKIKSILFCWIGEKRNRFFYLKSVRETLVV